MAMTGGCLCGAIRYELQGDPIVHAACHCRACQYLGGGSPSLVAIYPKAAVTITRGTPKTYWSTADSGAIVGRSFCEACGTPLFAGPRDDSPIVAVKAGGLDDPSGFKVQIDIWRSTAQPWHAPHPNAKQFEKNPGG